MMRHKSELIPLLEAATDGKLATIQSEWSDEPSVCVVLAAGGYPGSYGKGKEIHGLEKLKTWQKGFVFHAGTVKDNGRWLTSGGRDLGVTVCGLNIVEAGKYSLCTGRNIIRPHILSRLELPTPPPH